MHGHDRVYGRTADPTDHNDVTITPAPAPADSVAYTIADLGASLRGTKGCLTVDSHHATCSVSVAGDSSLGGFVVRLGAGHDRLDARAIAESVEVRGGRGGNDILRSGNGPATFHPGPGLNVLDGYPGSDSDNTVNFDQVQGPVRVDLHSATPQGNRSSRNLLHNISNVTATNTSGNVLLGTAAYNGLVAGPNSLVEGRGGNDYLDAGPGSRIIGGRGRAKLGPASNKPRHTANTYTCGRRNLVTATILVDIVSGPCDVIDSDSVEGEFVDVHPRPRPGQPFVTLLYNCVYSACEPRVAVRLDSPHGRLLAYRHVTPRDRRFTGARRYPVVLPPAAQDLLRKRHDLRIVVYQREPLRQDGRGRLAQPGGYTMLLHAP